MQQLKNIKEKILSVIGTGEILIIVPPFGSLIDMCLGPHILQALAEKNKYKTDILYLNMLLASIIGVERYQEIHEAPLSWMLGERLFARSAYGLPALGKSPELCPDEALSISGKKNYVKMFYGKEHHFDLDFYLKIEGICNSFIDEVQSIFASLNYKIIGCTSTTIGQNNCSIALLKGIKKYSPDTITIIGGTNCEGDMAEGIASLSSRAIDYIFSGESERIFLDFLKSYSSKKLPSQRILIGEPLSDLNTLPFPDYQVFYNQYVLFLGESKLKKIKIWYEASRGCWWAQKSKCTFCGIPKVSFRKKTTNKVLNELKRIEKAYPDKLIYMTDNIMHPTYQKELLHALSKKEGFPSLGYQLRASIDLKCLVNLKNAKINAILPGLETFSTHLLKLMSKGITGRQSLLFLRNVVSVGIYTDWFLVWGFPGDKISDYEKLLALLPLVRHLQPPRKLLPMMLMRFSLYHNNQKRYHIKNLRPWAVFNMIYPDEVNIDKLANYYIGEFSSAAYENPGIIREIANEVASWEKKWKSSKLIMKNFIDHYAIYDNRDLFEKGKYHLLDYQQAKVIMTSCVYNESEILKWAVEEKLGVVLDSWYIPLVTASPELLLAFEENKSISNKIVSC